MKHYKDRKVAIFIINFHYLTHNAHPTLKAFSCALNQPGEFVFLFSHSIKVEV